MTKKYYCVRKLQTLYSTVDYYHMANSEEDALRMTVGSTSSVTTLSSPGDDVDYEVNEISDSEYVQGINLAEEDNRQNPS